MKKIRGIFILLFTLAALAATAYAAAPTQSGVYGVEPVTGYTLTVKDADNKEVAQTNAEIGGSTQTFYPEAVRFTLKTPELSGYQLVLTLEGGSATPTEQNICYIDQKTADGAVEFEIYPSELKAGTYSVCLVGENGTLTKVAGFAYYQAYRLGDINNDGTVDSADALLALQYFVGIKTPTETQRLAANVNKDNTIDSADALLILKYFVGQITTFD